MVKRPRHPPATGEATIRLPPHSIEAEQAVLGGLMLDAAAWDQIGDRVVAEDFYRKEHRLIFEATAGLVERGQACDAVTLSGYLESQGVLDQVGGLSYLGSLARDTPTAANIRAYADIVRERSLLRQLITAGNLIVGNALEPEGREAREIIDDAERAVFELPNSDRAASRASNGSRICSDRSAIAFRNFPNPTVECPGCRVVSKRSTIKPPASRPVISSSSPAVHQWGRPPWR
jgi:replicative DNA helicase